MQYRPEIDGLRSIAVVPVILFHAGFSLFSGGFVGVDVFFVISGYLITSILLRDLEADRFSILRFYERRIRRIFPALFAMIVATLPFAWFILEPFPFHNYAQSLIATAFSASNILFWLESGYFDAAADLKPLLHTWSLAVEEQYYVVFPVILLLLWRLGKLSLFLIVGLLALVSLGLAEWMSRTYPAASFYLLPSRAWELLAGSLCAFWQNERGAPSGSRAGGAVSLLGLGLILVPVFTYDGAEILWPSVWTLAPVAGTALIILGAGPGTAVMRVLSCAPFVWIGLISYSAYLWHQPVFSFARNISIFEPSWPIMLVLSGLSLGLAWLSWRFIEEPFRRPHPNHTEERPRGPWLETRPALFATAAGAIAATVLIGALGSETRLQAQSWRDRQLPKTLEARQIIGTAQTNKTAAYNAFRMEGENCVFSVRRFQGDNDFDLALAQSADRIAACAAHYGPGIAVLGDSHGGDLFGITAYHLDRPFILGVVSGGCRAYASKPGCPYVPFAQFIADNPDLIETVLFEQAGFTLLEGKVGNRAGRPLLNALPLDARVPDYPVNMPLVDASIAYLQQITPHAEVIWLGMRPGPHIPYSYIMREGCDSPWRMRDNQLGLYQTLDAQIASALTGTGIRYIPQIDIMAPSLPEDFMDCEKTLWTDEDHLSLAGIARFGPSIASALNREISLSTRQAEHPSADGASSH